MDKIFQDLLDNEIADLAKEKFTNFAKDAVNDATTFLQEIENDLKKWTVALAEGNLSKDDFDWLIKSKKDKVKMGLLTDKGIAQIEIDKFRDAVIDIIMEKLL